jgi:hypothetical protein
MPQDVINFVISGLGAVLGWLLRIVWEAQKEQRKETAALAGKINSIEVLVAGHYMRRDEMQTILGRIDGKLDTISEKLDHKVDK